MTAQETEPLSGDRDAVLESLDTIGQFLMKDGKTERATIYLEAMLTLAMSWNPKAIPTRTEDGQLLWTITQESR